ncbi:MAG: hypothetical protein LBB25_01680, partial [Holosporaceae bacterium]|nr:hypothetical protein [Holosporaceae bacterium]
MSEILCRKKDHIFLARDVENRSSVNDGFGCYRFEHNALPEIDYTEIDTSINFLGRSLKLPLIISSITGGNICEKINRSLAGIAND